MPQVNARLGEISALIAAQTPFQRLTGTVYLDAQAAIQWTRLNVFWDVLDLLPIGNDYLRRFRIQDAAFKETLGVLGRRFGIGTYGSLDAFFRSHPNLQIDGQLQITSPVGKRALALRQQMCIQAGEDPTVNVKGHLGEAETLAMIEHLQPGSIFVTADKGAVAAARDSGSAHIVRPSAFTAGVMRTRNDVVEMWKCTCFARRCVVIDTWHQDCVAALECPSPNPAAADRSPVSPSHTKAVHTLEWAHSDLQVLVSVLAAKGD